jgi:hypothetical protein
MVTHASGVLRSTDHRWVTANYFDVWNTGYAGQSGEKRRMLHAAIMRTQYAVGHGGFHSGRIFVQYPPLEIKSKPVLKKTYIYDCGSLSLKPFDRALRDHDRGGQGRTDILFISHLDSDHVNGIDRLLGIAPAKVVVVPYLEGEDLAAALLDDIASEVDSASMHEYVQGPLGWWQRRGAETVIFIEGGDGEPPRAGLPDRPFDPGGELGMPLMRKGPQARLAAVIRPPRGNPRPEENFKEPSYDTPLNIDGELPQHRGILAGCGSAIRLEWRTSDSDRWRSGDWILLPYVHPVASDVRTSFRKKMLQELGLTSTPSLQDFTSRFLNRLRTNRNGLVSLYTNHFEVKEHNAISMSLYSGPQLKNERKNEPDREWRATGYNVHSSAVAWLGTGDSMLKESSKRRPWLDFFRPYSDHVFVLSLPHHGSSKNFHEEILDFAALNLAVATTIRGRSRIANLEQTLERVQARGKQWKIVDDQPENDLEFACARVMTPA